jgi:hypothetical protein
VIFIVKWLALSIAGGRWLRDKVAVTARRTG